MDRSVEIALFIGIRNEQQKKVAQTGYYAKAHRL